MKKSLLLLLLLAGSLISSARSAIYQQLPIPFLHLDACIGPVQLSADPVWVSVRNDCSSPGTLIESIDGLHGFQLQEPLRSPDMTSGMFTSRSNIITMHLYNAGFMEARIWVNGILAARETAYYPSSVSFDISAYPPDAWISLEISDAWY